jgi:hypothetical protein
VTSASQKRRNARSSRRSKRSCEPGRIEPVVTANFGARLPVFMRLRQVPISSKNCAPLSPHGRGPRILHEHPTTDAFLRGSDVLRGAGNTLENAQFEEPFPPNSTARLVRKGILFCEVQRLFEAHFTCYSNLERKAARVRCLPSANSGLGKYLTEYANSSSRFVLIRMIHSPHCSVS